MSAEKIVVDTNVLSELAKPDPDENVASWFRSISDAATSAVVVYEIARGIERIQGKRKLFLERWFAELLESIQVLSIDQATALGAAQLEVIANSRGRSIEIRDLFILATAQTASAILVTRNVSDFRGMGVRIYDPFSDTRM